MQFYRDSERGLQKVVRSGVETWIEHGEEVRPCGHEQHPGTREPGHVHKDAPARIRHAGCRRCASCAHNSTADSSAPRARRMVHHGPR
jgi:hypothetical protein